MCYWYIDGQPISKFNTISNRGTPTPDRVIRFLLDNKNNGWTSKEIARAIGRPIDDVWKTLSGKLKDRGVVSLKDGRWYWAGSN